MPLTTIKFAPSWPIYSQHPNVSPAIKTKAERLYLPHLVKMWQEIEGITGYKWKCTSYWRESPSHVTGSALDIAPDVRPSAAKFYAVTNMSDPVLYKRTKLIRSLQRLAATWPYSQRYVYGIFIEPDHLHLQIFTRRPQDRQAMLVVKWKVPKPVYHDTTERMKLPMI